ncbi:MAG: hypothetical protein ACHQD8_07175 [Chitinophagales bacterium]
MLLILIAGINACFGQTTFLPLGSEDYHVLDRLETISGRLCDSIANGDKPETRRNVVSFLENVKSANNPDKMKPAQDGTKPKTSRLSKIDRYNMEQMISESGEWAPKESETINSKYPWFHTFYNKQYDFGYVKTDGFFLDKDFFVVVNPVASGMAVMQHNDPSPGSSVHNTLLTNSQGAELRGWISRKVGFYTSVVDNQEQYPYYVSNWVTKKQQAVPGADYFLLPGTASGRYDYMQASGYINFDAVKNHVNVTFGSGKHFIGDGITSLFLTDYSSNMPFLQLQTRIWHINYECLYLELTPQYDKSMGDAILNHKFSTIHNLTWNVSKHFNLGFFESEVFDRPNVYEISYLNPIIFSTAVNRFNGSGDKSILGMSAKAIVAKHLQFYAQLLFNEFRVKELTSSKGWYGNKWGVQAGGKYFDAFTIKNLDLQGELNVVRPYTYSAQDTLANYTNYNQPLADPLGSGFIKATGIIRYQPVKNLYVSLKATYYIQGVDTGSSNLGNNVFKNYLTADHIYGVSMINGPKSHCEIISLNLSYQLRRNLFFDVGGIYRKYVNDAAIYANDYSTTGPVYGPLTTNYVYFGLRINAARREYDFF